MGNESGRSGSDGPVEAAGPPGTAAPGEVVAGDLRRRLERLPVLGLDRRTLTFVASLLVIVWLLFVFGRAITDSAAASDRASSLRAEDAGLSTALQARQDELSVVNSPAFIALEARAYGLGEPKEQVFTLQPGAPSPHPIVPLGADPQAGAQRSPLDAWMLLLLGH